MMSSGGTWIEQFPGNLTWSNAALVTKGMAPYGAVALGEIDEVCEKLKTRQGEADAWREEWCALAESLARAAGAGPRPGARVGARWRNGLRRRPMRPPPTGATSPRSTATCAPACTTSPG